MIYAGFWRRLAAHFIDGLIVTVTMYVGFAVIGVIFGASLAGLAGITASHVPSEGQHSSLVYRITPVQNQMTVTVPADQPIENTAPATDDSSTNQPQPTAPAQEYKDGSGATNEGGAHSYEYEYHESGNLDPVVAGAMFGFIVVITLIALSIGAAYHTLFIASRWQATPGKRVMGCMVVTKDGKRLSYMNAFGRHVACALSWLPWPPISIGFFLIGWTSQKTGLHDMIAGTRVVRVANADPVIATR